MSISLNTAGAMIIQSSGTGANSKAMTISAPVSLAAASAIAIPDPGAAANLMFSPPPVSANKIAAYQCVAADSGSIIKFSNAGANNITLPATATSAGFQVTVVQGTAQAAQSVQVIADGAVMNGLIARAGAAALTAAPNTNVNFLTGASQIGDSATFICNGSKWLVFGATANAAGMSFS
jgi:hypothetical protein